MGVLALLSLLALAPSWAWALGTPPPKRTSSAFLPKRVRPISAPAEVEELIFCNQPERLTIRGAYADASLTGGKSYRIFFHYRNLSGKTAPLIVAFQGSAGKKLTMNVRKGIADPTNDPPNAGRQAAARYLRAANHVVTGGGGVRFPLTLRPYEVASGVLTVRADQDVRLRIYFGDNKRVVMGARVVRVPAPRSEILIALTKGDGPRYYRIGAPEIPASAGGDRDGAYGHVYVFRVTAPQGSRVRVTFSPRGGQSGLVATIGGTVIQSDILRAEALGVLAESVVGEGGLVIITLPFGGVFYPVEIAFHLL